MPNKKVERIITPHDKEVARRLYQIYNLRKSTDGLTQQQLAKLTKLAQPSVSQYLRGTIALRNTETLVNFAKALNVTPEQIDPKFEIRFPHAGQNDDRDTLPTRIFSMDGAEVNKALKLSKIDSVKGFGILLDKTYEPILPSKSILIIDPDAILKLNHLIVVRHKNIYFLYKLIDITQRTVRVENPYPNTLVRDCLTRRRNPAQYVDMAAPESTLAIPIKEVEHMFAVRGIEFP